MSEKLNWGYSVQVDGGPTLTGAGEISVEAYLKITVVVPANDSLEVEILPGGGGSVQALIIQAAKPSADLTYEVDGDQIPLDGPHVLIGAGAVALLASTVGTLEFTNDTAEDAAISILAGRDATP